MPSTLKDIFVTVVIAVALFEVLEHVVLPLVVLVVTRKRKSSGDRTAMVGQIVEVRQWEKTEGLVSLKGELWKAVSDAPLSPGDKVVIRRVEGLAVVVGREYNCEDSDRERRKR